MQSSYSVIKSTVASDTSSKVINTTYRYKSDNQEDIIEQEPINYDLIVKDYEALGETIFKNARAKADSLMIEATQRATVIEEEAYKRGHEQGLQNGYEDGHKEGYEAACKDLENKIKESMQTALDIVRKAEEDYKKYMIDKQKNIENTIFELSKSMAFREIEKDDWVVSMMEPLLEGYKGEANLIIRANKDHLQMINDNLENWKIIYGLKGEIFVVNDMRMNPGNIIIETKTGKVEVGIDIAIQEIEKILSEEMGGQND